MPLAGVATESPPVFDGWRPDEGPSLTERLKANAISPQWQLIRFYHSLIPQPLARQPWWAQLVVVLLIPPLAVGIAGLAGGRAGAAYTMMGITAGAAFLCFCNFLYLGLVGGWGARFAQWDYFGAMVKGDRTRAQRARSSMWNHALTLLCGLGFFFAMGPIVFVGLVMAEGLDPGFMKRPIGGSSHSTPTLAPSSSRSTRR